jgi:3-hydroxybutyryl-CoA dehydratase
VKEINTEKNRVLFRTYVTNQDDKVVLDGEATIMPPKA